MCSILNSDDKFYLALKRCLSDSVPYRKNRVLSFNEMSVLWLSQYPMSNVDIGERLQVTGAAVEKIKKRCREKIIKQMEKL